MSTEEELSEVMLSFFHRSVEQRKHITGIPKPFEAQTETQMFDVKPSAVPAPIQQPRTLIEQPLAPPTPTVTSITPNSGAVSGNTSTIIVGTNFIPEAIVKFGGTLEAPGGSWINPQRISAITPPHAAGVVNVDVINAPGPPEIKGTLFNGYTYLLGPTITDVTPHYDDIAGGAIITIDGTNFISGATVRIGDVLLTEITFVNSTRLTGRAGAHVVGLVNVVVTNPDAQLVTLTNGFRYQTIPHPTLVFVGLPQPFPPRWDITFGVIYNCYFEARLLLNSNQRYDTYEGRVRISALNVAGTPGYAILVNGVNLLLDVVDLDVSEGRAYFTFVVTHNAPPPVEFFMRLRVRDLLYTSIDNTTADIVGFRN